MCGLAGGVDGAPSGTAMATIWNRRAELVSGRGGAGRSNDECARGLVSTLLPTPSVYDRAAPALLSANSETTLPKVRSLLRKLNRRSPSTELSHFSCVSWWLRPCMALGRNELRSGVECTLRLAEGRGPAAGAEAWRCHLPAGRAWLCPRAPYIPLSPGLSSSFRPPPAGPASWGVHQVTASGWGRPTLMRSRDSPASQPCKALSGGSLSGLVLVSGPFLPGRERK